MWQYTTETIINSNKGRLADGHRFAILDAEDGADKVQYKADGSFDKIDPLNGVTSKDFLMIDGVNSFKIEYISAIYRSEYRAPEKAEAKIVKPATVASKGDVLRLIVTLREEGRSTSYMQNAYLRHHKNFFYEIKSTGVWADDVKALEKLVNKEMALTDFDFFKASVKGSGDSAELVLEAKDYYIRFAEAPRIDKINAAPAVKDGAYLGFKDYTAYAEGDITIAGDLGAGTVDHLIKDLRLPSNANINPFGPDNGGKPVPGGKYTQYLIEYTTDRHHVAGGVMGSVNEKSLTSHILFIESAIDSDVENILNACATAAGITICNAGKVNKNTTKANPNVAQKAVGNGKKTDYALIKKDNPEIGSVQ